MFKAIVETQWKWTRAVALLATLLAFTLPLASLREAQAAENAMEYVRRMQSWGPWYALVAAGLGLMVALAAWAHDQRGRHVYALSLPVSRARYALMRFGAGALFLVPAVCAVLLGAVLVAAFGAIPEGLHVYPFALTLRFAFAALVTFALIFAVASSTQRTAGIIVGVIGALFFVQYALALGNTHVDLLGKVLGYAFDSPGVFSIFTGRWMLVDA